MPELHVDANISELWMGSLNARQFQISSDRILGIVFRESAGSKKKIDDDMNVNCRKNIIVHERSARLLVGTGLGRKQECSNSITIGKTTVKAMITALV